MKTVLAVCLLAVAVTVDAATNTTRRTVWRVTRRPKPALLARPVVVTAITVAPATPLVVPPSFCLDPYVDDYGRTNQLCRWNLAAGRIYEVQESDNNGATWRHTYTSGTRPEPLIDGAARNIFDITSATGVRIFRIVDWTDVPVADRPGPFTP